MTKSSLNKLVDIETNFHKTVSKLKNVRSRLPPKSLTSVKSVQRLFLSELLSTPSRNPTGSGFAQTKAVHLFLFFVKL